MRVNLMHHHFFVRNKTSKWTEGTHSTKSQTKKKVKKKHRDKKRRAHIQAHALCTHATNESKLKATVCMHRFLSIHSRTNLAVKMVFVLHINLNEMQFRCNFMHAFHCFVYLQCLQYTGEYVRDKRDVFFFIQADEFYHFIKYEQRTFKLSENEFVLDSNLDFIVSISSGSKCCKCSLKRCATFLNC